MMLWCLIEEWSSFILYIYFRCYVGVVRGEEDIKGLFRPIRIHSKD